MKTSVGCDRGAKCKRASAENIRDVGQAVVQKDEGQLCPSCRVQTQEHKHELCEVEGDFVLVM